jgi:pimeloyl-ACP methyl ester carboxylesterase
MDAEKRAADGTNAAAGRRFGAASSSRVAGRWMVTVLAAVLVGCGGRAVVPGRPPIGAEGSRATAAATLEASWPEKTYYRTVEVRGRRIFYREAGSRDRPVLLLLHGYPSSSHTYRELIPLLSGRYRVVAPDYLGSGFSDHPSPAEVTYTFDLLAEYVTGFVEALGLTQYVIYMQDFGAPVGFRVALAHPERLRGLVVQNANAYLDGLTEDRRAFFRRAREDKSEAGLAALAQVVSATAIRERQYLRDVPGEKRERMSPDTWTHDLALLATAEDRAIQVQLFQDYQTNIDAYPSWQAFLRARQPPTLIVWGRNDPAFISAGARAYLRDLPQAELHLLDAGHFAVEEQAVTIAQHVVRFMEGLPAGAGREHVCLSDRF